MWWRSSLGAAFLTLIVATSLTQSAVDARGPADFDRVLSCRDDLRAGSLVIRTSTQRMPAAPVTQFLPGPNGRTVFVADFPGILWTLPPKIIELEGFNPSGVPTAGIQEVHVGQFSEMPPVLRVSAIAKNPRAFNALSFRGMPGGLEVKWQMEIQRAPALAPPVVRERKAQAQKASPVAPPLEIAQSNQAPDAAPSKKPGLLRRFLGKIDAALSGDEETQPQEQPQSSPLSKPVQKAQADGQPRNVVADETKDQPGAGAEIHILPTTDTANVQIQIAADKKIEYTSFRLHDPERYVIDFKNIDELKEFAGDATVSPLLRGIRTGKPIDQPVSARLVLDLSGQDVNVKPELNSGMNMLLLTLGRTQPAVANAEPHAVTVAGPVPVKGTTVVLDAGHGGSDPGAQRGSVQEKELTLSIAERVKKRLEAAGMRVVMTRSDDQFVSLEDRVKITNEISPRLFLSVHINSMESTTDIHGIETYYQTDQSRPLADAIHHELVSELEAPDRAVRKARFYVINHTPIPAVLAEVGFISNKEERDRLISSDYQSKVAEALSDGVILYLSNGQDIQNDPLQNVTGTTGKLENKSAPSRLAVSNKSLDRDTK